MKYTLKSKLSVSYIIMALVCVFLISVLTNILLENQFKEYIKKNQETKNKAIVASISQQYKNGMWDHTGMESVGVGALENGLIIKVKNSADEVLWDAAVHNNGMCQKIITQMSANMNNKYPSINGGYVQKEYPILNNFNKIGIVMIGYYGPFYLSDNDLSFITTLNKLLIGVGVFSLLFAFLLGGIMAKRITTPILKIIDATEHISKGFFSNKININSNTKEIMQLTDAVNNLAINLSRQESLRKRLTADVAHELRTPLATLQSHLEAMIDGIWKPDAERLKSCHEETLRMNRMIGDLSQLAKYEAENITLDKTKFDISNLTQAILKNFEHEFLIKDVKLNFVQAEAMLFADKDKISQIIVNLISNALKYTQKGEVVEVSISNDKENVILRIKDSGIGIPDEDLPHIFERFYRVDKSRNRLTGGSGIGLTITKTLVEAHQGTIEVKSVFGEGSEFIVTFPRH